MQCQKMTSNTSKPVSNGGAVNICDCGQVFESVYQWRMHLWFCVHVAVPPVFKCPCAKLFINKNQWINHLYGKCHHYSFNIKQGYVCDQTYCFFIPENPCKYDEHLQLHKQNDELNFSDTSLSS